MEQRIHPEVTHGDTGDSPSSSASKRTDESLRRDLYTKKGKAEGKAEGKAKRKGAPSFTDLLLRKIGKSVSYEEFTEQLQNGPENFSATPTGSQWLESGQGTDYLYKEGGPFLKTEPGKVWFKHEGRQWTEAQLDCISREVQWRDGHLDNNSEASLKALKPFIELRPTEEFNEKLTAFDKHIQQLEQQFRVLSKKAKDFKVHDKNTRKEYVAMLDEPEKMSEQITQLEAQRKLYWEVLKERGQKGHLQPENRAYYDQQRKKELSKTHHKEKGMMEVRHDKEQERFILDSLEQGLYKNSGDRISWHSINRDSETKDNFLRENNPALLRRHESEKQELQERHEKEMNELAQGLQKVSFL
jgi:hypothetical protein